LRPGRLGPRAACARKPAPSQMRLYMFRVQLNHHAACRRAEAGSCSQTIISISRNESVNSAAPVRRRCWMRISEDGLLVQTLSRRWGPPPSGIHTGSGGLAHLRSSSDALRAERCVDTLGNVDRRARWSRTGDPRLSETAKGHHEARASAIASRAATCNRRDLYAVARVHPRYVRWLPRQAPSSIREFQNEQPVALNA
jgi:hypothetical protein